MAPQTPQTTNPHLFPVFPQEIRSFYFVSGRVREEYGLGVWGFWEKERGEKQKNYGKDFGRGAKLNPT